MLEIIVNPDVTVKIPLVGTYVTYQGGSYKVLHTSTNQQVLDKEFMPVFSTIVLILHVTDEGDDMGETPISVNVDELTEI